MLRLGITLWQLILVYMTLQWKLTLIGVCFDVMDYGNSNLHEVCIVPKVFSVLSSEIEYLQKLRDNLNAGHDKV